VDSMSIDYSLKLFIMIDFKNYSEFHKLICPPESLAISSDDDGNSWILRLYQKESLNTVDCINLESIVMVNVHKNFYNFIVENTQGKTLFDFLVEHTKTELELRQLNIEYAQSMMGD
jgi:hypothetical protein